MASVEIWWAMQPYLKSPMHYTNMKVAENCCISSCNLSSQGRFNGNSSHAFQIQFHLLYKITSAPVPFSLYIYHFKGLSHSSGSLHFCLASNTPAGHTRDHTAPHTTGVRPNLKFGTSPWKLRFPSSPSLTIRVSRPDAFWLPEEVQLWGGGGG